MAKSYSLNTIVALAVPLGVMCFLILVVFLLIALKYFNLSAKKRLIKERLVTGNLRRLSASINIKNHHSNRSGPRSWIEKWLIQSSKRPDGYEIKESPEDKGALYSHEKYAADHDSSSQSMKAADARASPIKNTREMSGISEASTDLAGSNANLFSVAPLRILEKNASKPGSRTISISSVEHSESRQAQELIVDSNTRQAGVMAQKASLGSTPVPNLRDPTNFHEKPRKRKSEDYPPCVFLIESGLTSAAELVNELDLQAEAQSPSPPNTPHRRPAQTARQAERIHDSQNEIKPPAARKRSSTGMLSSFYGISPPSKSALPSGRPAPRAQYAKSRNYSEGSIPRQSLRAMPSDNLHSNNLFSESAKPPRFKTPSLPDASMVAPPKQKARLSLAKGGDSEWSISTGAASDLPSNKRTSVLCEQVTPVRSVSAPYGFIKDGTLSPLADQTELQPSFGKVATDSPMDESTSELLQMAVSAYEDMTKDPNESQLILFQAAETSQQQVSNSAGAIETAKNETYIASGPAAPQGNRNVHPTLRKNGVKQLLPPDLAGSQDLLMKALLEGDSAHEGNVRVGRTHVDSRRSKHSLRGSVVASDSIHSRSRANSSKKSFQIQSIIGNHHSTEFPKLLITPSYEDSVEIFDANSFQFKEWLAADPDTLKPTPSPGPGSLMTTKAQDKIATRRAEEINSEQNDKVPKEESNLQSPLQLLTNSASSFSPSLSDVSDRKLTIKDLPLEKATSSGATIQDLPLVQKNEAPPDFKKEHRPSISQFSNSIRRIAFSFQAPISPRSPGYHPGQQLDFEHLPKTSNPKGQVDSQSQIKQLMHGRSKSSAVNGRRNTQKTKANGSRKQNSGRSKLKTNKMLKVNKPLPMTPVVLKDGVTADLGGKRFVVSVPYEGNLYDELDLHYNDVVKVYEVFDDGWCLARIHESAVPTGDRKDKGVCPKSCLVAL